VLLTSFWEWRLKEIREIFNKSLREESEQLDGHISQDRVVTNPKANFLCECCAYFLLLGRTVRIRIVHIARKGHDFQGYFWHGNRGRFWRFLAAAGLYFVCRVIPTFLGITRRLCLEAHWS
jgi:hypothetical protein